MALRLVVAWALPAAILAARMEAGGQQARPLRAKIEPFYGVPELDVLWTGVPEEAAEFLRP